MGTKAYYNENDKFKAAVIREAIAAGAIAPGDVDERSIVDVRPADLDGYTQCHFFAGGGFWSLALRLSGWPDWRPVWTGSCPCPTFSCAGKGQGFDDPRHLWPHWSQLITECRPPVIFGEQSDDAIGFGWLDLVQTDLEAQAYSVGKIVFGAAGVGAPQNGARLYFVGTAGSARLEGYAGDGPDRMGQERQVQESDRSTSPTGAPCALAAAHGDGLRTAWPAQRRHSERNPEFGGAGGGFWGDADWIPCRNPKVPGGLEWRPIKPGTFVLADGDSDRVGSLRVAGDAICVPQAQAFIEAYLDTERTIDIPQ